MHRTVYTVQKAIFCTEVYGASGHRMYSGCYTYCNQNSINIPTLTRKLSIGIHQRVYVGCVSLLCECLLHLAH